MKHHARGQLTELVRILEMRGHIFAADPQPVTEALRQDPLPPAEKLHKRARLIDADGTLAQTLAHSAQKIRLLRRAWLLMLLVSGFTAAVGVLAGTQLNFFYVLVSVLGMNSLMILVWAATLFFKGGTWRSFLPWRAVRGRSPVALGIAQLYAESAEKPEARWYFGAFAHAGWLAALAGILLGLVLMLSVRQYAFNWESTLFSDTFFIRLVGFLSWLPEKTGWQMPAAADVAAARNTADSAAAGAWARLLIASVAVYGILPRLILYFFCRLMQWCSASAFPLELPYYQNLMQKWQQKIVDADCQTEPAAPLAPPFVLDDAPKWAVLLDTSAARDGWFAHVLGQDWLDKGTADGRAEVDAFARQLEKQPAQLLIGIRAAAVPDRGILRQIDTLARSASGGAIVQLLADSASSGSLDDAQQNTLQQWHNALTARGIARLDPPDYAQRQRNAQLS